MRYAEFHPAPDLLPFVERYWALEGAGCGGPVLPDGHPELVFHFGARPWCEGARQSGTLLVGQVRTATVLELDGPLNAWGIRFHPHTSRAVLAADVPQSIEHWPDGDRLREALGNAASHAVRAELSDQWLRARVCGRTVSAVAGRAVRLLPRCTVRQTAEKLGCSPRHLERVFAEHVGLPPKPWTRIVRLQSALRFRELHPSWTWAAVAAEAGYADPSHLALDFRNIAGRTASQPDLAILSHSSRTDDPDQA